MNTPIVTGVYLICLLSGAILGVFVSEDRWKDIVQISRQQVNIQIRECEKSLPRDQRCVGEVKLKIVDKEI